MQKTNLTVVFEGTTYPGFEFDSLPLPVALVAAHQQIEQAAEQARSAVLGDPLRAIENQLAEDEAKAYKLAGYTGEVPLTVQAVVDAEQVSAVEAAEAILVESSTWRAALCTIRSVRLKGKVDVLKATSHDEVEVIADKAIKAIRASVAEANGTAV